MHNQCMVMLVWMGKLWDNDMACCKRSCFCQLLPTYLLYMCTVDYGHTYIMGYHCTSTLHSTISSHSKCRAWHLTYNATIYVATSCHPIQFYFICVPIYLVSYITIFVSITSQIISIVGKTICPSQNYLCCFPPSPTPHWISHIITVSAPAARSITRSYYHNSSMHIWPYRFVIQHGTRNIKPKHSLWSQMIFSNSIIKNIMKLLWRSQMMYS